MTAGKDLKKLKDGATITFPLLYTVAPNTACYINGFVGLMQASGDSGDLGALLIESVLCRFEVPAALDVSAGDIVYVDLSNTAGGHEIPIADWNTTGGANHVALFRAIEDKDSNDLVDGLLLPHGQQIETA